MRVRPDTVTDEDLRRWDEGRIKYAKEHPGEPRDNDIDVEVWRVGEWLDEQMVKAGATDKQREDAGFANGQRISATCMCRARPFHPDSDPDAVYGAMEIGPARVHRKGSLKRFWNITHDTLDRFMNGEVDNPGPDLASKLILENPKAFLSMKSSIEELVGRRANGEMN